MTNLNEDGVARVRHDVDNHYERSEINPKTHVAKDDQGNAATSFELDDNDGRVRLKDIQSFIRGHGHANKVMKHLTDLADNHGVTMELTASPHGDEKTRLDHDQLHAFYTKHGFEMEDGYDPAYGYMIRKPKIRQG